jgi:prepilin-type processing-associated H-X9-DG protein
LPFAASNLNVYNCPTENRKYYYTNRANSRQPMVVTPSTGFCVGYNDWGGINEFTLPYQGLGGDINPGDNSPWAKEPPESHVKVPADMICIADSRSDAVWDTAIDPADPPAGRDAQASEWPSRRHNMGANVMFCDGHAEYGKQKILIEKSYIRRKRWNADNQAHLNLSP